MERSGNKQKDSAPEMIAPLGNAYPQSFENTMGLHRGRKDKGYSVTAMLDFFRAVSGTHQTVCKCSGHFIRWKNDAGLQGQFTGIRKIPHAESCKPPVFLAERSNDAIVFQKR